MSTVVFNVQMSCGGCAGAVTRILKKLDCKYLDHILIPFIDLLNEPLFYHVSTKDVHTVDADLGTQKVTVIVASEPGKEQKTEMLDKLLKWASASGKEVSLVE